MYILIAFIPMFVALGSVVYALYRASAKEEMARLHTRRIRAVERRMYGH